MINIGSRIRFYRNEKGYSQEDMASLLGITLKTYGNLERDSNKTLDLEKLQKVAEVLKVEMGDFFGQKEKAKFNNTNSPHSQNYIAVYEGVTDKDLMHENEKLRQELIFLREKIGLLERETENLREINALLKNK